MRSWVAVAALFAPSVADAALSWSQPIAVDHNGQQRLAGLACSSSTRCVAIDGLGQTVTFNPASPSGAAPVVRSANATLLGIACPSDNQCTVVDSGGHAITFDPASSGGTTTATITSAPGGLVSIACPGVHQCTTLDQSGNEETFDPTSPGTVTPVLIDATNGPAAIQCPSTGECVALFNNLGAHTSHAVAFDPGSPATQTSNNLTVFLVDMSCPSITRCTAVAPLSGEQYSFDPTKTTAPDHTTIDSGHELMRVACSVSTQCTAVDTAGQEVSFDPTVPSALTPVFSRRRQPQRHRVPDEQPMHRRRRSGTGGDVQPDHGDGPFGGDRGSIERTHRRRMPVGIAMHRDRPRRADRDLRPEHAERPDAPPHRRDARADRHQLPVFRAMHHRSTSSATRSPSTR